MLELIIDGRKIQTPAGIKVIAAAEQAGIMIPRFCYHPALGSAGACRMCAVKFLEGPVHGLQMSCMVDVQDKMVISTTDAEAVEFRRYVIELLMLNHPHDCPVCDEGGHCLLQDETISCGHSIRRSTGKKRTYQDQYLGELVKHEMNRCIHCYRCQRFYQDFCGYRDFGTMGIGKHTYLGRYSDGPLENPFSGNLIDICPTGVLTDKPSRFKGRRWDFERAPSICIHCSLGCSTIVSARYREPVRVEARYHESVNGHFICDRGRFGFAFASHPGRPRHCRIGSDPASYSDTMQAVSERLKNISGTFGSRSIGTAASLRSSLETLMGLQYLAQSQGWRTPCFFVDARRQHNVTAAVRQLGPDWTASLQDVVHSDFILILGADPLSEAPMLALAIRQAERAGAAVTILDPRPVSLPFSFEQWRLSPQSIDSVLRGLTSRSEHENSPNPLEAEPFDRDISPAGVCGIDEAWQQLSALTEKLEHSLRPVVICGTDIVYPSTVTAAADLVMQRRAAEQSARMFYVLPGANAYGAALATETLLPFSTLLTAIENGDVHALLLVESDPVSQFPDQKRVAAALKKLDLLIVMDYLPTRVLEMAHITIPTLTHFETRATFVNQEGRLQQCSKIYTNGMPLSQLTGGNHPPRTFRSDIPDADAKPAWQILMELKATGEPPDIGLSTYSDLWSQIGKDLNVSIDMDPNGIISENQHIFINNAGNCHQDSPLSDSKVNFTHEHDRLELLLVESFYGTEELSTYAPILNRIGSDPQMMMHPADAVRRGLNDDDMATLSFDSSSLQVKLKVVDNMAQGLVILPRHRLLEWQQGGSDRIFVRVA